SNTEHCTYARTMRNSVAALRVALAVGALAACARSAPPLPRPKSSDLVFPARAIALDAGSVRWRGKIGGGEWVLGDCSGQGHSQRRRSSSFKSGNTMRKLTNDVAG